MNENDTPETGAVPPEAEAPAETSTSDKAEALAGKVSDWTAKADGCFAKVLGLVENHPWEDWLAAANGFIGKFLPLVVGLAGVLAFATGLAASIRNDLPFSLVLANFGVLVAALFSMHLAPKAMSLPRSFVEKREPDAMRPELLYLLKILLGLGGFVLAVWLLLQFDADSFVAAIVLAVVSAVAIVVFSHPALVGAKAEYPANAVEETIAILLLPAKFVLSLLTLVVGVSTVILFVAGVVQLFDNGMEASFTLMEAALAPLVVPVGAYVLYLATVFVLDLYRAVVCLPRKLDDIRKALESR